MNVRKKKETAPFRVGQRVTTTYHSNEAAIVRRVLRVVKDKTYKSRWGVSVDGGEQCPICKRVPLGTPIPSNGGVTGFVDSSWFTPHRSRK